MGDEQYGAPPQVLPPDPILEEVYTAREALLEAAGYDLDQLARRLRAAQSHSGRPVVALPPKPAAHGAA